MTAAFAELSNANWRAWLSLRFNQQRGKTVLADKQHQGPLLVQKPFYPEQDVCHVYLIHPPGGVVGGDQIHLDINVQENAHALVTTPAANKFYFSNGQTAAVKQHFRVENNALLEWLPQENILFNGSRLMMETRVELDASAAFIGCEATCLGRPHANEKFTQGKIRQHFELWRDGKPMFIDRCHIAGGNDIATAKWGLNDHSVYASLVAYPASKQMLQEARQQIQANEQVYHGITLLDDVLVYRLMSEDAESLRQQLQHAWSVLRPMINGRNAVIPRIWLT